MILLEVLYLCSQASVSRSWFLSISIYHNALLYDSGATLGVRERNEDRKAQEVADTQN